MKRSIATAIGVLMAFGTCTARADVVTDWNVTANALVANDVGNNPRLRTLAMVHVAMSDAINAVQNRYTRVVAMLPAAPGAYVPTTPPLWEQYARAQPWVLKSADQFRPGPPPALSSAEWARDYNEVKSLGGAKSTARTPEQTEAVKFWGNVNFGGAWQAAARELSIKKEMTLAECARLFALLNMSLANAYIVNWDAKYTYNFWRPVTAIRNGDQDGNDATERDAGWTSFNPTPMHPEYPSQATINATIASAVLESVFGPVKAIPFTATDVRDPKRTRQFASLADMAEEQKNVRVWGGVHYRFAIRTSEEVGRKVAAYMIDNTLQPVR
jgi:PAP2 superfamily